MFVTTMEFEANYGRYPERTAKETLFSTRNENTAAKVVNPKICAVDSLRGMLREVLSDIDLETLREERRSKYENNV